MKTIWKWYIPIKGDFVAIEMPTDAEILCVQNQDNHIAIWALCGQDAKRSRYFEVNGTGNLLEPPYQGWDRKYIGTVQIGSLVWHVFERVRHDNR